MYVDANTIVLIGGVVTAVLAIGGVLVSEIKWLISQNKQSADIAELRRLHEIDMKESHEKESAEIMAIKDELCVLSYAMLASLDGLRQLHCNGEVTKAHEKLEKHLNQQAHGQKQTGGKST